MFCILKIYQNAFVTKHVLQHENVVNAKLPYFSAMDKQWRFYYTLNAISDAIQILSQKIIATYHCSYIFIKTMIISIKI